MNTTLDAIQKLDPTFSLDDHLNRLGHNVELLDCAHHTWRYLHASLGAGAFLALEDGSIYVETQGSVPSGNYQISPKAPGYVIHSGADTLTLFRTLISMYELHADTDKWVKAKHYQHYP